MQRCNATCSLTQIFWVALGIVRTTALGRKPNVRFASFQADQPLSANYDYSDPLIEVRGSGRTQLPQRATAGFDHCPQADILQSTQRRREDFF